MGDEADALHRDGSCGSFWSYQLIDLAHGRHPNYELAVAPLAALAWAQRENAMQKAGARWSWWLLSGWLTIAAVSLRAEDALTKGRAAEAMPGDRGCVTPHDHETDLAAWRQEPTVIESSAGAAVVTVGEPGQANLASLEAWELGCLASERPAGSSTQSPWSSPR